MCNPLAIAGVALQAGGAYHSGRTQANYINALNQQNQATYQMSRQAREAELARQQAMEREGWQNFDRTLGDMDRDTSDANREARASEFTETLAGRKKEAPGEHGFLLPGQGESTVEVRDSIARSANTQAAEASDRIRALSQLSALGSDQGDRAGTLGEGQDLISMLNNLRRGSLGVSQFEQTIPGAQVTPGSSLPGALMSGAGMLLGTPTVQGMFGGAPAAFPQNLNLNLVGTGSNIY